MDKFNTIFLAGGYDLEMVEIFVFAISNTIFKNAI